MLLLQQGQQGRQLGGEKVAATPVGKAGFAFQQLQNQPIGNGPYLHVAGRTDVFAGGGPQQGGQADKITRSKPGGCRQAALVAHQQPGAASCNQQNFGRDQAGRAKRLPHPQLAALQLALEAADACGGKPPKGWVIRSQLH